MSPSDLKRIHTKVLLNALDSSRRARSLPDWDGEEVIADDKFIIDVLNLSANGYEECTVTIADLKEELSHRPHVPNKVESITSRKARKLASKRPGRRDR